MPAKQDYRFHQLSNGLRVVTERLPQALSVSFGFWVEAGSRHENPSQEGMAHLWEHMAFKGTDRLSALDIAKALDLMGGQSNAYTSREHTCFHARVTARHLPEALGLMAEILLRPKLDPSDLAKEKDVVLQEIASVEEDPEEQLMDAFWQAVWPGGSLAHSILGTPRSVESFTGQGLWDWRRSRYTPRNMMVAAAGAVDHEQFLELMDRHFAAHPQGEPAPVPEPGHYSPEIFLKRREAEQNHVVLAFPCPGAADEGRFTLSLLNTLLGGNMSSRLFQEVRERRGLAYSVYSFANTLADQGVLQVCAAVDPERTLELMHCLRDELGDMAGGGIAQADLDHARDHLMSLLALSLEASEDRMSRLARNQLLFGRYLAPEETVARFEAVTLDQVRSMAADILHPDRTAVGVLGPMIDPAWPEVLSS